MKKVILTVIAVATLTLYSCEKTVVKPITDTSISDNSNSSINSSSDGPVFRGNSHMSTWHDNGKLDGVDDVDFGCWGEPGGCFPAYVLIVNQQMSNASMNGVINGVINAISRGNRSEIKNSFKENKGMLMRIVRGKHVQGLISDELTVSVRGKDPKRRYMKFTDVETDAVAAVYPIEIKN